MKWIELNVMGSLKLLEYSRLAGCKRYIFISTEAVYGRGLNPDKPLDELTGAFPYGGYAAYNRAVEVYVGAYHRQFDMTGSTSIRLCGNRNYGLDRNLESSAWIKIVRAALGGDNIHVAGLVQPDWCGDMAKNIRLVAGLPLDRVEDVYCLCDEVFKMADVARAIVEALGSSSKVIEDGEPKELIPTLNHRIKKAGGSFGGLDSVRAYARELAEALKAGTSRLS
jgi:nucleoside-diphosphate-sugar epimerase